MHFSLSELMVILWVALIVIKPAQLPDAARLLGRSLNWLRNLTGQIQRELNKPIDTPHDK